MNIRPFRDADQPAFRALNLAWIEKHFTIEPSDLHQLDKPRETILSHGGAILVADASGEVVGSIGVVPHGSADRLEIVKMAVADAHRGRGIGRALLSAALDHARKQGAKQLWLESNTRLEAATHLYRAAGFVELPRADYEDTPYSRCNLQMICDL
ncbi:MAG: GNAT family N-acetyltransferase [Pseudomonadota bacterium]